MTNVLTLAALATVAVVSVTSPVFAQAFDLGARYDKAVTVGSARGVLRSRQIVVSRNRQRKMAAPRRGLRAFATVPGTTPAVNSNEPALTGGGSLGYNQNLYNY